MLLTPSALKTQYLVIHSKKYCVSLHFLKNSEFGLTRFHKERVSVIILEQILYFHNVATHLLQHLLNSITTGDFLNLCANFLGKITDSLLESIT